MSRLRNSKLTWEFAHTHEKELSVGFGLQSVLGDILRKNCKEDVTFSAARSLGVTPATLAFANTHGTEPSTGFCVKSILGYIRGKYYLEYVTFLDARSFTLAPGKTLSDATVLAYVSSSACCFAASSASSLSV
jgi:hypothetical protein